MALSEYMPYGAPELLAGARSRMARSTALASLGVVILIVSLGAIATRGFTQRPALAGIDEVIFMLDPPPSPADHLEYAPPMTDPAQPEADPNATVRPVPELPELVEPERMRPPTDVPGVPGTGDVSSSIARGPASGTVPPAIDEPELGRPVFVDEYPNVVRCSEARYPDFAREAGVEGTVHVHILVGPDGRVRRAVIAQGGSVPMLDEAALDAARSCVFTPALTNGHPVMVWVSRSYRFSLH